MALPRTLSVTKPDGAFHPVVTFPRDHGGAPGCVLVEGETTVEQLFQLLLAAEPAWAGWELTIRFARHAPDGEWKGLYDD